MLLVNVPLSKVVSWGGLHEMNYANERLHSFIDRMGTGCVAIRCFI